MSRASKGVLASMGLDERTVSIASNANPTQFHQLIIDTFPSLLLCDGYSLLKCDGKSKVLEMIETPSGGHTPMLFKAIATGYSVSPRSSSKDSLFSCCRYRDPKKSVSNVKSCSDWMY